MELHTPRFLARTDEIDVYARGYRAKSRLAVRLRVLLQLIAAALAAANKAIRGQCALRKLMSMDVRRGAAFRLGERPNRAGTLEVFVVTKDDVPYHATFSKHEASLIFDGIIQAGTFRQASVVAVSTMQEYRRVLFDASQAA